jgi:hypothetical protein
MTAIDVRRAVLPAGTIGPLAAGGICRVLGLPGPADVLWAAATMFALVPAAWWVFGALRQRRPGVGAIAVLALVGPWSSVSISRAR